jgi:hypothetical protein
MFLTAPPVIPAADRYDFNETLSRLEDVGLWLSSLGLNSRNRVRVYTENIRQMIEVYSRGGMDALQDSISIERAREVFWSYIDADEFVRAVSAIRDRCGEAAPLAPIDRAVNGPADFALETKNNNEGRNFMFELIMGGRIAAAGFTPFFDRGPDVYFEFAGVDVAVQCKRPFSIGKLERNIEKAIDQLRSGNAGLNLIAVSVSRLVCPADPFDIPNVPDRRSGSHQLTKYLEFLAERTVPSWRGKLGSAGILFYAFAPFKCPGPQYFPVRADILSSVTKQEPTDTLLKCLAKSLV